MDLHLLQRTWDDLARSDAMWAVLTRAPGETRAWEAEAFFRSGVDEVRSVIDRVRAAGATPAFGRALDFGCGLGRLTQALADHFARVDGVDIAPAMIERARSVNRAGERCAYHLNAAADLGLFPDASFDFIYSNITLQHMEPTYSRRYIEEFFRVARPGAVVVFQLPSESIAGERPRTQQADRLPREACRATIQAPKELRCAPGAVLPLRVMIRNDGTHVWAASDRHEDDVFAVRLGNHWRSRFGFMRQFDDLRSGLACDLGPGEWIEVGIDPTAPLKPGVHVLELDIVQEYVRWFAESGSKPWRIRVLVDGSLRSGEVLGLPPVIEMHCIPRAEVEALISACGGELFAADVDDAPGPDWKSFRYVAGTPRR